MFAKAQFAKVPHAPSTAGFSFVLRLLFANRAKINRHTKSIESPVSHSKQRTGHQINRHTFGDPPARKNRRARNPFASCASFSFRHSAQTGFTTHQSPLTIHSILIATRTAHPFTPAEDFTNHELQVMGREPPDTAEEPPAYWWE